MRNESVYPGTVVHMSITALFAIVKIGNKPNIYERANWFLKMLIYVNNGKQPSDKQECIDDFGNNLGESQSDHAEEKKPDRKYTLCNFI